MTVKRKIISDPRFNNNFNVFNPALFLGLLIISLGLFLILWIFLKTREFEILEKDKSPDSNRSFIVLMVFPFLFYFFYSFLNMFSFLEGSIFMIVLGYILFSLVYFLILKFVHDFCKIFGEITRTSYVVWFLLLVLGMTSIFGFIFDLLVFKVLILMLFIVPPLMQIQLNVIYKNLKLRKEKNSFYN